MLNWKGSQVDYLLSVGEIYTQYWVIDPNPTKIFPLSVFSNTISSAWNFLWLSKWWSSSLAKLESCKFVEHRFNSFNQLYLQWNICWCFMTQYLYGKLADIRLTALFLLFTANLYLFNWGEEKVEGKIFYQYILINLWYFRQKMSRVKLYDFKIPSGILMCLQSLL